MPVEIKPDRIKILHFTKEEALESGELVKQLGEEFSATSGEERESLTYYWEKQSGVYKLLLALIFDFHENSTYVGLSINLERSDPRTRPGYEKRVSYVPSYRRKKLHKGQYFYLFDTLRRDLMEQGDRIRKFCGKFLPLFAPAYLKIYDCVGKVPYEHHELYTDIEDYEESVRADQSLMKQLKEAVKKEGVLVQLDDISRTFKTLAERFQGEGNFVKIPSEKAVDPAGIITLRRRSPEMGLQEGRIQVIWRNFTTVPELKEVWLAFNAKPKESEYPTFIWRVKGLPESLEDLMAKSITDVPIKSPDAAYYLGDQTTTFRQSPLYAPLEEAIDILAKGLKPPYEHHELHSDIGEYEESGTRQWLEFGKILTEAHADRQTGLPPDLETSEDA